MTVQTTCLGRILCASARKLDEGWDVSLFGGDSTHVGAVTLAGDGALQTMQRPGHRDSVLSERWAEYLANRLNAPVCVRCGIHYDRLCREDLPKVLETSDDLMKQLERMIG